VSPKGLQGGKTEWQRISTAQKNFELIVGVSDPRNSPQTRESVSGPYRIGKM
jgi:hypothetical protein